MLSLASASCYVTKQSCSIHFYEFSTSCPNSRLVVRLYQFVITFPCSHFVHTFAPRKHVISGVVFTHPIGYSRPPSAVNDPSVTKWMNSRKSCPEDLFQTLENKSPCSISTWFISMVTFIGLRSPPRTLQNSTMKKKKNCVPIVGFVELLLFCFNCCKVDNACLKSGLCSTGTVLEPVLFEVSHHLLL